MEQDSNFSLVVPVAAALAVTLALAEVLIDWLTAIRLNIAVLYGLPLVVTAAVRSQRLLWGFTLCLLVSTFAVYSVQIPPGVFSLDEPYFINRVLAALALVLSAALLHVGIVGLNLLEEQRRSLKEQNEELERQRQRAEEASSYKSRFLRSVSHDIRTPLQSITLMADFLSLAAEDRALATQVTDTAHRLQTNIKALTELVGDMLDLARFEDARDTLKPSEFSLNDLLAEECSRVLPLAEAKGLSLTLATPEVMVRLRSDRTKLVRIIANLLSNAIKYTDSGGVTVAASCELGGGALIRIRDTGSGIPPEQSEHIFDEYVQLQNPNHERGRGQGLGLAICRRLSGALGGTIAVDSTVGSGSTFTLQLPAASVIRELKPDRTVGLAQSERNGT